MDFFSWLSINFFRPTFWFQPGLYAVHGWLATEMALWMLFHPYQAKYLPGSKIQIPFTPGIFPKGQARLAEAIGKTVTETLLTPDDIKKQADSLLTEENIRQALHMIFNTLEKDLQSPEGIKRMYRFGDVVVPSVLHDVVNNTILDLEEGKGRDIKLLMSQFYGRTLPHIQADYPRAELLVDVMFSTLLTPAQLRIILAEGLTARNIHTIEHAVHRNMSGLQGLVARFVDIKKLLHQLRDYLTEQPLDAEATLTELIDQMEVREKLAEEITGFSAGTLPEETRTALDTYLTTMTCDVLVDHRETIADIASSLGSNATRAVTKTLIQADYKSWIKNRRPEFDRDIAQLIHRYLQKELGNLLTRLLPKIEMERLVTDKLNQFSARDLETIIHRICHQELRWLALLGGFLGFWLGLLSNIIAYWEFA